MAPVIRDGRIGPPTRRSLGEGVRVEAAATPLVPWPSAARRLFRYSVSLFRWRRPQRQGSAALACARVETTGQLYAWQPSLRGRANCRAAARSTRRLATCGACCRFEAAKDTVARSDERGMSVQAPAATRGASSKRSSLVCTLSHGAVCASQVSLLPARRGEDREARHGEQGALVLLMPAEAVGGAL